MDPDTDLLLQATTSVAAGRTVWSGAPRTLCSKRKRESSRVPARVYRPSVVSQKRKQYRQYFSTNFSCISLIFNFSVRSRFLQIFSSKFHKKQKSSNSCKNHHFIRKHSFYCFFVFYFCLGISHEIIVFFNEFFPCRGGEVGKWNAHFLVCFFFL